MELGAWFLLMTACIAASLGIVFTIRKAVPRSGALPSAAGWTEVFAIDRPRPMPGLLNVEDFRALRSQPECQPEILARLRRQRCQIFRQDLRSLREDFDRECFALKLLTVQAGPDRPRLTWVLRRSRLRFELGMALVQSQLLLSRCGFGAVDAASPLRIFAQLQAELRRLIPAVALGA